VSRISAPVDKPTFFGSNVIRLRGRPESRADIASHQRRPQTNYDRGVLSITIPVAENAKPRSAPISSGGTRAAFIEGQTATNP